MKLRVAMLQRYPRWIWGLSKATSTPPITQSSRHVQLATHTTLIVLTRGPCNPMVLTPRLGRDQPDNN